MHHGGSPRLSVAGSSALATWILSMKILESNSMCIASRGREMKQEGRCGFLPPPPHLFKKKHQHTFPLKLVNLLVSGCICTKGMAGGGERLRYQLPPSMHQCVFSEPFLALWGWVSFFWSSYATFNPLHSLPHHQLIRVCLTLLLVGQGRGG